VTIVIEVSAGGIVVCHRPLDNLEPAPFNSQPGVTPGAGWPRIVRFGDVNGDAKADLVYLTSQGVMVRRSLGGLFGADEGWTFAIVDTSSLVNQF
jgi:hypothetical protein